LRAKECELRLGEEGRKDNDSHRQGSRPKQTACHNPGTCTLFTPSRARQLPSHPPHLLPSLPRNKRLTLITQQPMHIPNMHQILLMLGMHTERILPLMDELEDLGHGGRRERRWSLGEPTDELVEKVFGRDLEVEGVAAVFDEDVEELARGEGRVSKWEKGGREDRRTCRASMAT
jgi:hypothetical protein